MKKYLFLILVPFLLLSTKGKGQAVIGISPYSVIINNDTLPGGATDSVSFWVVNSGTMPLNDSIRIYTNVQDSVSAFLYYQIDTLHIPIVTIAPGDSMKISLFPTYDIGPLRYHYDINVIVIWPVAYTASTTDSLVYNEFLTLPIGINELDLTSLIRVYPNPSVNNLTIENTSKNSIEEVRIYDSSGRLVSILNNPTTICTEDWPPGTYLVNVVLKNRQRQTLRIIKQ